jgi:hypothetical protein
MEPPPSAVVEEEEYAPTAPCSGSALEEPPRPPLPPAIEQYTEGSHCVQGGGLNDQA